MTKVRIFGAILNELSSEGSQRIQYLLLALSGGRKLPFQQTFVDQEDDMTGFVVESVLGEA